MEKQNSYIKGKKGYHLRDFQIGMFHVEKRGKVFATDKIQMDLFALFNLP